MIHEPLSRAFDMAKSPVISASDRYVKGGSGVNYALASNLFNGCTALSRAFSAT
jgi:hypothetical protein